jgi:putative tryptophan/tyrosine transport system substrate-binding protein
MKRLLALVATLLLLGGCGTGDGDDDPDAVTIAFLRAVAGVPSTEPAFVSELRRAGFREGDNLTILAGDANEAYPNPDDAATVVRQWRDAGVDLIVALSTTGARIAAETAPDVHVLFLSNDPTASGLVDDETAPEGNLTGATFRVPADRTLSLTRRAVDGLERVGLAYPPDDPAATSNRDALQAAADDLGIELVTAEFSEGEGTTEAVAELAAAGVDALIVSTSPIATRALAETLAAAEDHGIPVVANTTLAKSAILSLSPDTEELGRQLGRQAARLLAGADPSTVPVEDPNHFRLTLNARAAEALGISLPEDLLREANEVVR